MQFALITRGRGKMVLQWNWILLINLNGDKIGRWYISPKESEVLLVMMTAKENVELF